MAQTRETKGRVPQHSVRNDAGLKAWLAKRPSETAPEPDLPIIDPHHHFRDIPHAAAHLSRRGLLFVVATGYGAAEDASARTNCVDSDQGAWRRGVISRSASFRATGEDSAGGARTEDPLTRWTYLLAVPLAFGPVAPSTSFAQQASTAQTQATQAQPAAPAYTQAELEQIFAPIALYPDDQLICVDVDVTGAKQSW
jgi:hypothetical protein